MAAADAFYVTTPIYYVNDVPHIGHAYTTVACDSISRFARLDGRKVYFLTGTDEHGQKVEKAAADAGIPPRAFTDRVSERFRELAQVMRISNDDFIRTTEPRHHAGVQALWRELVRRDQIYLGRYAGWYSVRDETYYAESELIDGAAPTGAPVEWVEEPSNFFRHSGWQERLLRLYVERPDFVLPAARRNEVISFVKGGLQDLSVSRTSFSWGIPVPDDPDHVVYVWLDALTNYMTALGYPDTEALAYRTFWPADVHVVGKDILRFHAVFWPAFLLAAGLEPPKRVFAHGWWTIEGQKMSKSLGNAIDTAQLIETYGLDQIRYFLLREVPFGNDGDFSRDAIITRMNRDLAND
jgi:methionyl-tRNA synthetase